MSASGTRERLRTIEGAISEAASIGVTISRDQARLCLVPSGGCTRNWMGSREAVSVGPIVYFRNRLAELGNTEFGTGAAEDTDDLPIVFSQKGRGRNRAWICDVARSKMFRTPLIVFPIDLTALKVAGADKF
jgi:hypothetical protein